MTQRSPKKSESRKKSAKTSPPPTSEQRGDDDEERDSVSIEFRFPPGEKGLRDAAPRDIQTTIPELLKLVKKRAVAVQAGGAAGVWPRLLANSFDVVYTFEPNSALFPYLVGNACVTNIVWINAALGIDHGMCHVVGASMYQDNMGAWQTVPGGAIPVMRLDDFAFPTVDLLALDVEGAELAALKGASRTLQAFHPTICIEDKGIGSPKGEVPKWLEVNYGYRVVAQFFNDVVLQ